jgi:HPt (histidine-containing phosphotransfer) domain-containing protein
MADENQSGSLDTRGRTAESAAGAQCALAPADRPVAASSTESAFAIVSSLPLDEPVFVEIIKDFIGHLKENLSEMRSAIDAANFDRLTKLAHWLKGTGGTIGFECFTEPTGRLERFAIQHQAEGAAEAFAEIMALAKRIATPA